MHNHTGYRPPSPIPIPPIYRAPWKWNIGACLQWFWSALIFPYGVLFIALAAISWHWLTPAVARMATWSLDWVALIYLRNAALLFAIAGGLHFVLYIRRRQHQQFKFDPRWSATDNRVFLWRSQIKDNMFWSLASGVTVWSLYESVALW